MSGRVLTSITRVLALACVALMPAALAAQDSAKPADKYSAGDSPSKWDIFAGYSYLAPHDNMTVLQPNGKTATIPYHAITGGGIVSVARYFNKYVGVEGVGDIHLMDEKQPNGFVSSKDDSSGGAVGLIFRYPTADITPFVHGLVGANFVGGPEGESDKWGAAVTAGGGVDYATPLFDHRLAIRVFQADYQYNHVNFGPGVLGGRANLNEARLSAGIVIHVGTIAPPPPVTLSCAVSPTSIFPGDPVTASATAGDLEPKMNVVYSFTGVPGLKSNGAAASLDSAASGALAPGNYTVSCGVKEGKPGKEGLKPWESASATANFTVKQFEPPTISCSASPANINPNDSSVITASGVSPQNRPLTYSYSASAGTINGTGTTANFASAGAPSGPVSITCSVSDDKGQTATASAGVTIAQPPPPPGPSPEQVRLEARLALHSVFFPTAQPRADKPEGGLVASQETTLTTLATDFKSYLSFKPDAHLILSGHADVRGSVEYNQALSERRVGRVKQFLVEHGVSESAIETRGLGKEQELTADQVKALVEQNPDLSDVERKKVLHDLNVIVLAQNRRVDITLTTTGQQSVQLYPFNAADSLTLLDKKSAAPGKKAVVKKSK